MRRETSEVATGGGGGEFTAQEKRTREANVATSDQGCTVEERVMTRSGFIGGRMGPRP